MNERIASPSKTIEILQTNDFQFLKKFGQNFLIDLHVLDKIIRSADVSEEDVVLEIGPGIGSLTQVLAEKAKMVIAVEIDDRLIPILQKNLAEYPNLHLIHADFLKLDLRQVLEELDIHQPIKVIANLPYYITTPIIMGLYESHIPLAGMTVMVQEEVARRMQAGPGSKDYGALSLAVQYYADASIAAFVPPNCFMPRPGVGSSVVQLTTHVQKTVEVLDEKQMFAVIKAAFGQRRKTLVNALSGSPEMHYEKEQILSALQSAGLSVQVRGEALTLSQFALLSNLLKKEA